MNFSFLKSLEKFSTVWGLHFSGKLQYVILSASNHHCLQSVQNRNFFFFTIIYLNFLCTASHLCLSFCCPEILYYLYSKTFSSPFEHNTSRMVEPVPLIKPGPVCATPSTEAFFSNNTQHHFPSYCQYKRCVLTICLPLPLSSTFLPSV